MCADRKDKIHFNYKSWQTRLVNHVYGNREQVYSDSGEFLDQVLDAIQRAQSEILLQTYIFANDFVGKAFLNSLEDACRRGVKVYLLIDGIGSPDLGPEELHPIISAGGEVQVYHPFPWQFSHWTYTRDDTSYLFKAFHLWENINRRNHSKLCLVDRQVAWLGSQNITKSHLPASRKGEDWFDIGVALRGLDFSPLIDSFFALWSNKLRRLPKRKRGNYRVFEPFAFNYARWQRKEMYSTIFGLIANAKKRVWLINAYFLPNSKMLRALIKAAENGNDVRLILPLRSDVSFVPLVSRCFYAALLKAKVRLFEYKESMLHAKSMVLDDWHVVGSSNLTQRSFLLDLELNVRLREESSKKELETIFDRVIESSIEITSDDLDKIPWYKMLFGRMILFFTRAWL